MQIKDINISVFKPFWNNFIKLIRLTISDDCEKDPSHSVEREGSCLYIEGKTRTLSSLISGTLVVRAFNKGYKFTSLKGTGKYFKGDVDTDVLNMNELLQKTQLRGVTVRKTDVI